MAGTCRSIPNAASGYLRVAEDSEFRFGKYRYKNERRTMKRIAVLVAVRELGSTGVRGRKDGPQYGRAAELHDKIRSRSIRMS